MRSRRTQVLAFLLALVPTFLPVAAWPARVELVSKSSLPVNDTFGRTTLMASSADGRWVAFLSTAPNLVAGQQDENDNVDVFLRDRMLGTTTLISHAAGFPTRAASPGFYDYLDISADGRYVVFSGLGADLVPGGADGNEASDVFLWDRVTGTTTLVSHATGSSSAGSAASSGSHLSADGNFVVFLSRADNLVAGQAEPVPNLSTTDVFLWNRAADTTTLVSRQAGSQTTGADQSSLAAALSADGGVVIFSTLATNLVPNIVDVNSEADVYAYRRSTNTLSLVSRYANALMGAAGALPTPLVVSADGRYVALTSHSEFLAAAHVDNDPTTPDLFLYDRATDDMRLASHLRNHPALGSGIFGGIAMSADGRYLAFSSTSTDLVAGQVDLNEQLDVFVYDRVGEGITLASHVPAGFNITGSLGGGGRPGVSAEPSFSADGRYLAFTSLEVDLAPGQVDPPDTYDVFLYDQVTRAVALVSHVQTNVADSANNHSFSPQVSADGSLVAFLSQADDLGEGQIDFFGLPDLFFYDRSSTGITTASRREPSLPPPVTAAFASVLASLSADARQVAFENPVGPFVSDTATGTADLISPPPFPPDAPAFGQGIVLSADSRWAVLKASPYSPLGPTWALYLQDRVAGTFTLVNHAPGSPFQMDGTPQSYDISPDGRWIAYSCSGCVLVPGHTTVPGEPLREIFLFDRLSGTNLLVSRAASTSQTALRPNGESASPVVTDDGRYVIFWSYATDLLLGQVDLPNTPDLFVFDRESGPAGSLALITHSPGLPAQSASVLSPSTLSALPPAEVSVDGRFIAFQSALPNLVDGQVDFNGGEDVFLYNQGTRSSILVSHAASSPLPAAIAGDAPSSVSALLNASLPVSMSADGRFIAYESFASNLVAGVQDSNGDRDVFLYDRLLATNSLVSYRGNTGLVAANGASGFPRLSADGHRVAFITTAPDLLTGQTPPAGWNNLYVQDQATGERLFIARALKNPRPFTPFPSVDPSDPRLFVPQVSADGRRVAFSSEAALAAGDYNGTWDVYLWDQDGVGEPEEPEGPIAVTPCRLLDTRRRAERPILTSDVPRLVTAWEHCGVPATAKTVVVNVTVFNPSGKGNLRFYPGAPTGNPAGILRFESGQMRTETFTLPLSANGTLTVLPFVRNRGTVHAAVEVTAYSNEP